jgi:hypothetical protein
MAAKKIVDAYPEFDKLLQMVEVHDASKFEEPEKTPYISITWRHKLEDERGEFDPIKDKGYQTPGLLAKEDENRATLHHITTNSHHPEYHLKSKSKANIDDKGRDNSKECVDASMMPDLDIAEMVADWQAMSWELGTNTARDWFNKQKDVRWHFSKSQEQLIDKLLGVFEKQTKESICESEVSKDLWMKLDNGLSVWLVSGPEVRKSLNIEFIEGGHGLRYDFIPEDQVWIEQLNNEQEQKFILIHELHEHSLMLNGITYDEAHDEASAVELEARKNPENLEQVLAKESKK